MEIIMKENKDRMEQNVFIAQLQRCLDAFDEAERQQKEIREFIVNTMPKKQQEFDTLREDYLHLLENYDLDPSAKLDIATKIEKVSNDRRVWRNINEIARQWVLNEKKLRFENERPFFRELLKNRIQKLDQDYKFRSLTEEQVKELTSTSRKAILETIETTKSTNSVIAKVRRKHFTKEEIEGIKEDIRNGMKNKDIAVKYQTTNSAISHYRIEMKKEQPEVKKKRKLFA